MGGGGGAMVDMGKLVCRLQPLAMSLAQAGAALAECHKGCVGPLGMQGGDSAMPQSRP